jgi:DNA-binding MarR family transcriptional regulator
MGLWAKSILIFNSIREHGKQSIRRLVEQTGLSKSSVHRHLQAINRRDCYPESSLWETETGRTWLIRLVVAHPAPPVGVPRGPSRAVPPAMSL